MTAHVLPMGCPGWDRESAIVAEDRAREARILAEALEPVRFVGDQITLGVIVRIADGLRVNGLALHPAWIKDERGFIVGLSLTEGARS